MDTTFYGRLTYRYIDGALQPASCNRHERVQQGESIGEFRARMLQIVEDQVARGATEVEVAEEVTAGRVVGCSITWSPSEMLESIASCELVGGRTPGARGQRGSGRSGSNRS